MKLSVVFEWANRNDHIPVEAAADQLEIVKMTPRDSDASVNVKANDGFCSQTSGNNLRCAPPAAEIAAAELKNAAFREAASWRLFMSEHFCLGGRLRLLNG